jgi:hypothetical protein
MPKIRRIARRPKTEPRAMETLRLRRAAELSPLAEVADATIRPVAVADATTRPVTVDNEDVVDDAGFISV